MKIKGDQILFEGLVELTSFLTGLQLLGQARLSEPVVDNSGNVLIKENIPVKSGMLEKLHELAGQYKSQFSIEITNDLQRSLKVFLGNLVEARLKKNKQNLIGFLHERAPIHSRPFIRHSLLSRGLLLGLYRLHDEEPDLFSHLADLGLMSLGFSLHQRFRKRMMHRYAFLAGLCADVGLAGTNQWKHPAESQDDAHARAQKSADIVGRLQLPQGLAEVITAHAHRSEATPTQTVKSSPFDDLVDPRPEEPEAAAPPPKNDPDAEQPDNPEDGVEMEDLGPDTQEVVIELLRVARFIQEGMQRTEESNQARKLLEKLAYNCARGYFPMKILEPILVVFKEYEESARRVIQIASVERECIHPPSAWAYPKPNAAQVLCRDNVVQCPHLVSGWDIHVVSLQEAFGWIGTTLPPGSYPKCQLESGLPPIQSSTPAKKN